MIAPGCARGSRWKTSGALPNGRQYDIESLNTVRQRRVCGCNGHRTIAASSQNILNKALVRLVYACAIEH